MTAVNTDPRDTDYGLIAREVLALARGGTLHVRGIENATPTDAMFYDNDGLPTFVVAADAPLVGAALDDRGAVLAIPAGPETDFTQLVLGGDLCVLEAGTNTTDDTDDTALDSVASVALRVHTVVLERDTAECPSVSYRTVALEQWREATPDPMRPAAQRILAHTNRAHGEQLREYVASLRCISPSEIVAAELRELDALGVDVHWVDARGAHRTRLHFDEPAGCAGEMAAALRATMQRR